MSKPISWHRQVEFMNFKVCSFIFWAPHSRTLNCLTLQQTNLSHLRKRKIIFKSVLGGDMLVPRRVVSISWVHPPPIVSNRQYLRTQTQILRLGESQPIYATGTLGGVHPIRKPLTRFFRVAFLVVLSDLFMG